jgi:hypothetical protein
MELLITTILIAIICLGFSQMLLWRTLSAQYHLSKEMMGWMETAHDLIGRIVKRQRIEDPQSSKKSSTMPGK